MSEKETAPIIKYSNIDLIVTVPFLNAANGLLRNIATVKSNRTKFSIEASTARIPLISKNNGRYKKIPMLSRYVVWYAWAQLKSWA